MADKPHTTNPTSSSPEHDDEPLTIENAATLRFDGVKVPFPSMNEWLDRARNAYPVYALALAVLEKSDEELETAFRDAGLEGFELRECCESLVEAERAGVEMLDSIIARLLIISSREALKAD